MGPGAGYGPARGEAWSLAAEAGLWQNLQVRGEIAGSGYDPDDPGQGPKSGLATTFLINYHSLPNPADRSALFWQLGMEDRRVDPLFHSLGNPGLAVDLEQLRLFGGVRRSGANLDFSLTRERNNLADSPRQPTWRAWRYHLQLDYAAGKPLAAAPLARLGTPGVKLVFTGLRRQPLAIPEDFYLGYPIDCSSRQLQLQAVFRHPRWNWGIGGVSARLPGSCRRLR